MKIIVIDGPDGVGKTTVAKLVTERLKNYHLKAEYIHFPNYEYYTGDFVNKCLHGELGDFTKVNPYAQHMMYALDRYCWFSKNKEKYKNHILIFDRYTTSSKIYQTAAKFMQTSDNYSELIDWFKLKSDEFITYISLMEYTKLSIPIPERVFWLNIDKESLNKRINNRVENQNEAKDNFEEDSFAEVVYKVGQLVSEKENWYSINASGTPEEIAESIISMIKEKVKIDFENIESQVP